MTELVERYRRNADKCLRLVQNFSDLQAKRSLLMMANAWLVLAAQRQKTIEAAQAHEPTSPINEPPPPADEPPTPPPIEEPPKPLPIQEPPPVHEPPQRLSAAELDDSIKAAELDDSIKPDDPMQS